MGFGSWAKKHLSVRLDSHTLGNLAKNLAPAAALTPAGVLGAGALGLAGELGRGKNIGQAAKAGLSSAVQGGGLASVAGKLGVGTGAHVGFGIGGGGAAAAPSTPGLPGPAMAGSGAVPAVSAAPGAVPSSGFGLASAGKGVLNFAEAHPNAAAGALQGLGNIVGSGAENRLQTAQADALEQKTGETQYDFEQRKRREAELAPLWGALGTSVGNASNGIAPNPYAARG